MLRESAVESPAAVSVPLQAARLPCHGVQIFSANAALPGSFPGFSSAVG